MPKRPTMQGWWDKCKEMQYSRRKPCNLVEAFGITFKAIGVPAMADLGIQCTRCSQKHLHNCKNL